MLELTIDHLNLPIEGKGDGVKISHHIAVPTNIVPTDSDDLDMYRHLLPG